MTTKTIMRRVCILGAVMALAVATAAYAVPVRRSALTNSPGIVRVADLPADPMFEGYDPRGREVALDLGYSYREMSLLWMLIWAHAEGGLVLYAGSGDTLAIAPAGDAELARIEALTGTDHAEAYRFPIEAHVWGWLPILGVVGTILLLQWRAGQRREALDIG